MRPIHLTIPLAFIPLFVCLPNMSFPIAYFFGFSIVRDSINLCGSVLLCAMGGYAFFLTPVNRRLLHHFYLLLLWITCSLLVGLRESPSMSNLLFYVQTVLPLLAVFYGYSVIRTQQDISKVIRIAIYSTNFVVIFLYLIVFTKYGFRMFIGDRIQAMYEIEYGIPQFKSYYPVCVQFTFSLALAQYLFARGVSQSTKLVSLAIHASFLIFCWSRAGLLGFGLTMVVQFFFVMFLGSQQNRERTALVFIVLLLVIAGLSQEFGTTVGSREEVHSSGNSSDEKRLNLFLEGLDRCVDRPLFGDSFIPAWDEREGGLVEGQERLFGSHNQYVDLALRGGFFYALLFMWLVWKGIRNGMDLAKVRRTADAEQFVILGVAGSSFLVAVAIESNFQLYFIQLLTAVPCMMLIGMIYRARYLAIEKRLFVPSRVRRTSSRKSRVLPESVVRRPAFAASSNSR